PLLPGEPRGQPGPGRARDLRALPSAVRRPARRPLAGAHQIQKTSCAKRQTGGPSPAGRTRVLTLLHAQGRPKRPVPRGLPASGAGEGRPATEALFFDTPIAGTFQL